MLKIIDLELMQIKVTDKQKRKYMVSKLKVRSIINHYQLKQIH